MRGLVSSVELKQPAVKVGYWVVFAVMCAITISYLFPTFWMVTGALKSSLELLQFPPTLLPKQATWSNYQEAWTTADMGRYFGNTIALAFGQWLLTLIISAGAAFSLSRLKPKWGQFWFFGFIAMLMVPGDAILVPRFLSVVHVPFLHISLLDTWWAVWLPGAVSAFIIFLFKNFFDQLPTELFDAAQLDGASAWQIFFRIVLPLSTPIISVVSIFTLIDSWKSFFWPLLVLSTPQKQPIMVALFQFARQRELNLVIAALVIASLPTLILFIIFQKRILSGVGYTNMR